MTLLDDLCSLDNLNYAWRKAKVLFNRADGYVDNGEITAFELNLANELLNIQHGFRALSYALSPLRPLPRPKKLENGKALDRQYFHVPVRDQVAWIAMTNILGPRLDPLMPAWSYGNRIYRTAWFGTVEGRQSKKLEIGPYRHASGHLYRRFQHSWPLFRRHIVRTARLMAGIRSEGPTITEEDQAEEKAFFVGQADNLAYFKPNFWRKPKSPRRQELHHASIDLEKFFPSISRTAIVAALTSILPETDRHNFHILLSKMLDFTVSIEDIPPDIIARVEPLFSDFCGDNGIPTGLFVAGFLANAVFLPIDQEVEKRLGKKRRIAHFRYVDDHTIIAYDFDDLCDWIREYCDLIRTSGIGVDVNKEKFDPKSLGAYLSFLENNTPEQQREMQDLRTEALNDTRIDGTNPTKLLTKTLGQVSAVAAGNVHIMDDDDLKDRLKLLEWLLLADIPDREIRPDTRAAFAAGQIATLVPLIAQSGDGIVDKAREIAELERELRSLRKLGVPDNKLKMTTAKMKAAQKELKKKETDQEKHEKAQYSHCFDLLMRAFKEFPGKPRLFYRLCHYCLLTGHPGLNDIASWIVEQRREHVVWADYYAGLGLQILATNLFRASSILENPNALRSDQDAARAHIEDITRLDEKAFVVPGERAAWFHKVGERELYVSLISVAAQYAKSDESTLVKKLNDTATRLNSRSNWEISTASWRDRTEWSAGVWAEWAEKQLSVDGKPSAARSEMFVSHLVAHEPYDVLAMRRYPELLPHDWWQGYLSMPSGSIPFDDAGWWRDVLSGRSNWREDAKTSHHEAIRSAANSLSIAVDEDPSRQVNSSTLLDWLQHVSGLSKFDPRRSEWTALQILKGVLETSNGDLFASSDYLDRLHPANVLIPKSWFENFPVTPSWESWREVARAQKAKIRDQESSVADYRFAPSTADTKTDSWLGQRVGLGRILLGLLQLDFNGPRIWNIRGNEHAYPLARRSAYERLSISSQTLLILEGCLSARSKENFQLTAQPGLFGTDHPLKLFDIDFDAPQLDGPDAVVESIIRAQTALVLNQIAVSGNQPRQLIPFRIEDFAVGEFSTHQGDGDAE